ncbi:MAG: 16S rRNA (uracil(1498)-N(3))-methyltransferase, partial [Verrucomicrobia bacterium]|nr:16S rRNA (uracil(1498)-N(3))-methyltransferase [Verrucomicrobiota bacterium]
MPGHRFYNPNLSSGKLSPEESHHAVDVLRLRPGDSAAIFDGKGTEARARLIQANAEEVTYETLSTTRTPPLQCRIRFGQALIKPAGMDLLIQKLTELGVSEIWPIASERSVPKPSGEKRISDRWLSIALSACKQSGQNWLP